MSGAGGPPSRAEVCRRIETVGIVPVIRAPTAELALRAAEAVLAGGISIFEITMTVPDAPAVIRALVARLGDRAVVGAGTVLDAEAAHACIDAGAAFVVSPGLDLGTVAAAHGRGVPMMPGALTPTEVIAAWKSGAEMVKIFPCGAVGGPKYLRALRGPLPDVKLLPTGGVNAENAADYIAAGAAALGVGSELVDIAALAAGNDAVVTERARALVAAVKAARDRERETARDRDHGATTAR
jgi:2-dehydro-3-deoxyphosphogluconate aldolase/(4S)-4-hydroxy-2-oxoglutarate aldolase